MIGNAQSHDSFPYIVSYLNSSDTHILLKCSALEALGGIHHKQVSTSSQDRSRSRRKGQKQAQGQDEQQE